jgi:hypothetical protein
LRPVARCSDGGLVVGLWRRCSERSLDVGPDLGVYLRRGCAAFLESGTGYTIVDPLAAAARIGMTLDVRHER